jgi:hypothetical protein
MALCHYCCVNRHAIDATSDRWRGGGIIIYLAQRGGRRARAAQIGWRAADESLELRAAGDAAAKIQRAVAIPICVSRRRVLRNAVFSHVCSPMTHAGVKSLQTLSRVLRLEYFSSLR